MDRRIPVFNRLIISKTVKQNQLSHLKRLDAIKVKHLSFSLGKEKYIQLLNHNTILKRN
jgi:hypothetical protein